MTARIHTPYRICPLGAHVDHQHGLVSGFALDRGVTLNCEPTEDGSVDIASKNFAGRAVSTVRHETDREMHWGDYARAAIASLLNAKYELTCGIRGEIEGTLPIGGLSSSAAVIITYLRAICAVNGIQLPHRQLIDLAHWAETRYIGLNNGILDQSCEVYGKKDHLLFLDTRSGAYELIPQPLQMPRYKLAIIFSGVEHALINSAYNARVDECKAAAYALKAFSGMPYEKIADTRLRDADPAVFERYGDRLPENWRKRALHYYTEVDRVARGVEAWKAGDLHRFGQIVFESGNSSIHNYESGSPELKALHEIALKTDGVYGGRFSCAGFKGCYLAIVDPAFGEAVERTFTDEYLKLFPELKERFCIHFCESADGVQYAGGERTAEH
jgi:galactokinase/galacturonokinase